MMEEHSDINNFYKPHEILIQIALDISVCVSRSRDKTDHDIIRENHRFLWDEHSDAPDSWGARLAKKYYDKLFKEYCICDLSYYKFNKVALRWRTEKEVIAGKGQFECGNKKCGGKEGLRSWEVNFGYEEQGQKKNALVKLRLCDDCSSKLNHHSQKREVRRKKGLKRLGTTEGVNQTPSTSYSTTIESKVKEEEQSVTVMKSEEVSSQVWREKVGEPAEKSREEEFEEYLADLLL